MARRWPGCLALYSFFFFCYLVVAVEGDGLVLFVFFFFLFFCLVWIRDQEKEVFFNLGIAFSSAKTYSLENIYVANDK